MLAHIRESVDGEQRQSLREHSVGSARFAGAALESVGLYTTAYLAGLVHDMGKAKNEFQQYLRQSFATGEPQRGSVNHTFAAVRFLLERYHASTAGAYAPMTAELLAYAVGSHHGLFDGVDERHASGFRHRLEKEGIGYEESRDTFLEQCTDREELDRLFATAVGEVETFVNKGVLPLLAHAAAGEDRFYMSLLARLLMSAVMEGDRRDTAAFMQPESVPRSGLPEERQALWRTLSERVDTKLEAFPADSPLRSARQTMSRQCRACAEKASGIYRLNLPTGAGKTLSSLRYALAHAAAHGKRRIIFTSPLLSILQQNAKEIRRYVQDDSAVLEHHSNVVRSQDEEERLDPAELLVASWESPIIITTLVQLLNTMFEGQTGCVRRFHALCNSVIVIDEVQTVPSHLLSLFQLTIGFLATACHATVVLCSATQPCSEATAHPIGVVPSDMVPYDPELWKVFRRTTIQDVGSRNLDQMPAMIQDILNEADSLLVICNKKSEAERLYNAVPMETGERFYLSASMCIAHREEVLDQLKTALRAPTHKKILCVSTQVIEAGVDISFERVVRLAAGMDSIVQSAGRCNRNQESETPVPVRVVACAGENLNQLPDILRGKAASLELLSAFRQHPDRFQNDLASDEAIRYYYRRLYREMPQGLQDGPVVVDGHQTTLFTLLSDNAAFADAAFEPACQLYTLNQAFKTAGRYFTVFQNDTTDVLVPYGKGKDILSAMMQLRLPFELGKGQQLAEQARPYTVSLYSWQKESLMKNGSLLSIWDGRVLALQEDAYDAATGLVIRQENDLQFLGV